MYAYLNLIGVLNAVRSTCCPYMAIQSESRGNWTLLNVTLTQPPLGSPSVSGLPEVAGVGLVRLITVAFICVASSVYSGGSGRW